MLALSNVYIRKNVKVFIGYRNATLYDFNCRRIYLISKNNAELLLKGKGNLISKNLFALLNSYKLITDEITESDDNPSDFEYGLFDDKNSYEKCKLIYLEVTNDCNYNCVHCYANLNRGKGKYVSLDDLITYIAHLGTSPNMDIRITGGEPFLHKDICKILDIVSQEVRPITQHSIVTNGSFDIEKAFYALKLGYEMQFSIYGISSVEFAQFTDTNVKQFEIVKQNLELLSKSKYRENILLQLSVNALTYKMINKFVDYVKQLGFKYRLNRPASIGRATQNWNMLQLDEDDYITFSRSQKPSQQSYCYHLCQLYWTAIDVNGNITPCTFLRSNHKEYVMGNLLHEEFEDIWTSLQYQKFRKYNADNVERCNMCEFKFACTAGCCGETLDYTGNLFSHYVWCKVKPFQNENYLYISDDEMFLADKLAAGAFDFIKCNN